MNYPIRPASGIAAAARQQLSQPAQRALRREVEHIQVGGVAQAVRTQVVEYVGFGALRAVENLSNLEAQAISRNPLGAARYEAIVNTAVGALAYIVADAGRL